MEDTSVTFVVGNSRQIHELSEEETFLLDSHPRVFTINWFPVYWHFAGFRPTHWAQMDCLDRHSVACFNYVLEVLKDDEILISRAKNYFVNSRDTARELEQNLVASGIPFNRFTRGYYPEKNDGIGRSFSEKMLQCASSLVGAVNIAHVLFPETEIRLYGCELAGSPGHFYDRAGDEVNIGQDYDVFTRRMWEGFGILLESGVRVFDCNKKHSSMIPECKKIPKKRLTEGF